ncbi:MAG: 2OG-Fe(II) oxygenase [Acetobacteraceae bacterium]
MSTTIESRPGQDTRFDWLAQAAPLLRTDDLPALAERLRPQYIDAQPFPHIVIDDLFEPAVLDRVLDVFPAPDAPFWQRFRSDRETKLALDREDMVPMAIRMVLYTLNSASFLNFLETLTGIQGLIPDSHWDGGGLHQIQRGGKLAIHADFNSNNRTHLDRRLNLLLYLNKDWNPSYGGDLELWDQRMTACVKKVPPLFNRIVIFSTTDTTYHGHPDALTCPPERCRRSLALYYYSNGRPEGEASPGRSTLFVRRPGDTFKTAWHRRLTPRMPKMLRRLIKS